MRIVFLLLFSVLPAWALSPQEQITVTDCYVSDAMARGKDQGAMVLELLNFIFLGRNQQKNQLATVMQRCRDRITASEQTYDADTATGKSNLTASGVAVDGALSSIPTMP